MTLKRKDVKWIHFSKTVSISTLTSDLTRVTSPDFGKWPNYYFTNVRYLNSPSSHNCISIFTFCMIWNSFPLTYFKTKCLCNEPLDKQYCIYISHCNNAKSYNTLALISRTFAEIWRSWCQETTVNVIKIH